MAFKIIAWLLSVAGSMLTVRLGGSLGFIDIICQNYQVFKEEVEFKSMFPVRLKYILCVTVR